MTQLDLYFSITSIDPENYKALSKNAAKCTPQNHISKVFHCKTKAHQRSLVDFGEEKPPLSRQAAGRSLVSASHTRLGRVWFPGSRSGIQTGKFAGSSSARAALGPGPSAPGKRGIHTRAGGSALRLSAHFHDDSAPEVEHGLKSGNTFCFREENEGAEWHREGERRGGGARAGEQVGAGGLGMEGPLGRNCIVGFRA
eukprot:bmy_08460T0